MVCRECAITEATFAKRSNLRDIPPDEEGTWTTKQVFAIVLGDKETERLRLTTEQADKIALENAEKRRDLIHIDDVLAGCTRFVGAAKARLSASNLSDDEKHEIMADLSNLETVKAFDAPRS